MSHAHDSLAGGYGYGSCYGHHGELLQGVFEAETGLERGLLTLPCMLFRSDARVVLRSPGERVTSLPAWKVKARRAAELTMTALDLGPTAAELHIASNIPPARGLGSSTADVVAAARAVMNAAGASLPEATLARLAVEAETASDSLMIERVVLFAHRRGRVLEELGCSLPPMDVVGFYTGEDESGGVDTLTLPPARYATHEIESFSRLRASMTSAVRHADASALGAVATESAYINQAHLPVPRLEAMHAVAEMVGAAGIQVSHSGDIGGLLFDSSDGAGHDRISETKARLREIGVTRTWHFTTTRAARNSTTRSLEVHA